jgi:hypothetical protein
MANNTDRILHQDDVEAVIDARVIEIAEESYGFGTVALLDTGTAAGEVPTNGDLGTASVVDTGTDPTDVPTNAALGDAAYLDVGTTTGHVAAADDGRIVGAVQVATSTTTNLTNIAHAINTAGKVVGQPVWDATTKLVMYPGGTTAGSHWYTAAGVDTITPV